MEWLKNMNDAIRYIEEHLTDEIQMQKIAQIAGCSAFHFQRMFSYMVEVPLSEYIRRRKMTRAAIDLQNGEKVLDVAVKYGYDSPTAFNRAFKSVHGTAPSKAKKEGILLKAYNPISFKMSVKGEAEMKYRIEKKEAFRIVGVCERFPMNVEENFKQIPRFWRKAAMKGYIPRLVKLMNGQPMGVMGVSTCNAVGEDKEFAYYIAVASSQEVPKKMEEYVVPAGTWAVFESVGPLPQALQDLQRRVVTEWLPASGYEYANAPDIELYSEGNQQAKDYYCEVWLPIVSKENK